MSDRHDIVLREAEGPAQNPSGLISELRDLIKELFPDTLESGRRWLRGKSDQEVAKATEIRASALEKLGHLELERQKLLNERDAILRNDLNERARDENAHKQRMCELRTQRLQAIVECMKHLKELGVTLNARVCKRINDALIAALEEGV